MPTIGDKLTAIYDIKNKIRDAIVNKGGALHEKSALSDYPQAIYDLPVVSAPEDTYNYHPNPAWWDIKTIIENDDVPEGYVAVAAFLLIDSPYKTTLDVYDAYKTSDGMFYNSAAEHIWDTTKDKDSGEGYKTRYVIAYVKKDSDRWLGKMLCARNTKQGAFYAIPVGCLGMTWNCPVFVSLECPDEGFPMDSYDLNDAHKIECSRDKVSYNTYSTYYSLCICAYSWHTIQYINVTKKGKLIISDCRAAFTFSDTYSLPTSLYYIAPLYEVAVIYNDLLAEAVKKSIAPYITLYYRRSYVAAQNTVGDIAESLKEMNGYRWGINLKSLELHLADKAVYANTFENASYPAASYLGGLYTCSSNGNSMYYAATLYPMLPRKIKLVIETNTIPLDGINFYPLDTYQNLTVIKYVPRLFVLFPYDTYKLNTEDNCTLGIIDWTIINKSDTKPQVHLFPAYQLNGMPASKLNKFIVDYLQDRTGMSVYQMYITASQNEKLSSTTKQIIAKRNWTLVVFS